jgi:dTDP-4-dehydrorhamnose 3,5-epimerase
MKFITFNMVGPVLILPEFWSDGHENYFSQYDSRKFANLIDENVAFVQENESLTHRAGTIRGLHYQSPPHSQGKLIKCTRGRILDVVVDARVNSSTYGEHICVELSSENNRQLWIPAGFIHGFATQTENTIISYKVTNYYSPNFEGAIKFDDPDLGIDWKISGEPIVSEKDAQAPSFSTWKSPFLSRE